MLINAQSKGGSAVLELAVSAALVFSVGFGVYIYQNVNSLTSVQTATVVR